jgi:hypothetical protein
MTEASARRWTIGLSLMVAGPIVGLIVAWPLFALVAPHLPWSAGGVAISVYFALPTSRMARWMIMAVYGRVSASL